jgi:hypothetical protein
MRNDRGFVILLLHVLVSPFNTQARLEEAASIECAASARTLEAEADGGGPTALRLALSAVSVGVQRVDDFPTRDPHPMASHGVPPVLALEVAQSGRSAEDTREIRRLIREMSLANRLWGAPRIHGELLKLGIEVAQSTIAKYMARSGRGRSETWKTFLHNHAAGIGAMDFLVVPTVGFGCSSFWSSSATNGGG